MIVHKLLRWRFIPITVVINPTTIPLKINDKKFTEFITLAEGYFVKLIGFRTIDFKDKFFISLLDEFGSKLLFERSGSSPKVEPLTRT